MTRASTTSARRRWLFRFVAVAAGMTFTLLCAEIWLHILWDSPRASAPLGSLTTDPDFPYINAPNYKGVWRSPGFKIHLEFNSKGLRDIERPARPEPGAYRILALGDSYVEGHGVEYDEMFTTIAERSTPPPPGFTKLEMVKAGFGGWGPTAEATWLAREGFGYNPHAVLYFLFAGNDFQEAQYQDYYTLVDGLRVEREKVQHMNTLLRTKIFFRRNIYLYGLLVDTVRGILMDKDTYYAEDRIVLNFCDPRIPLPMDPLRKQLIRMRESCKAHGTPFRVIILPQRLQVEAQRLTDVCGKLGLNPADYDMTRPTDALLAMFREEGIDAVDFTPVVREAAKEGPVGFTSDSHYNPRVTKFVGERLTRLLTEHPIPTPAAVQP